MLKTGDTVGRWRVRRYLGHGATSTVYEADDETGMLVALKVLHLDHLACTDLIARFVNEALPIRHLFHPGLPRIHDVEVPSTGAPFITMELLGKSLADRQQQGGLTCGEALAAVAQIAAALAAVHVHGIVHRDVKPQNTLFAGPGHVKLIDFGLAKFPALGAAGLPALPVSTLAGDRCGTPEYRAPELWRDAKAAEDRADVYSLGVLLYEVLTGQLPFRADTAGRLRLLHAMSNPPRLRAAPPISTLFDAMLAKDPRARPTAAAVAARLGEFSQR